jgi:predicted ATPase/DNA-binding winged helix-turn-helix (wHTH) protein
MPASPQWVFGLFRLAPDHACLWREAEAIVLPPKAFAVLHYLVTHPDRLVTKDELLDAVWPETAVSDAVVRVAIGALRQVLGDTARTPRFIATVPRRGYRFLAPVTRLAPAESLASPTLPPLPLAASPPPLLVEREVVLQRLHAAWAQARQGRRQAIWVTGEAGIGKTAVVEAFAAQVRLEPAVWLAHGQCIEHYGTGEAYLPVLEALEQLCRGPGGEGLVTLLRQHAPTWLVQLPWLLTAADREQLRYELQGATRERMLREFAEAVDTLTAETPLLLLLEDLHWSDSATLDLLALLVRRRTPARLLVVGTYRPVAALVPPHPLRTVVQDMQRYGAATELPLAGLSAEAVAAYLVARFPRQQFPVALALWLHQRTDGQPLFLVTLVQALMERGVLHVHDGRWTVQEELAALALVVPESLRQVLEQQITRLLPEAQRVLEVASVAGGEFVAAVVAAGLAADADAVEEHCEALVGQQLLRRLGVTTWPNGTVTTRYAFVHALYQQVVYERLREGRRMRLHQRLGEVLEAAYGTQAGEIAAELAEHYVRGQDTRRAVRYLYQAAENAAQRYAPREVIDLLTRALALLRQLPEAPERLHQELDIQMALGPAWMAIKGFVAPEVEHAYTRARELCQQMGDTPQLFPALYGVWSFARVAGALQTAQELAEQLLRLAQSPPDSTRLFVAHHALASTYFYRGELASAHTHAQQGNALYNPEQHRALALLHGFDPEVICLSHGAVVLWLLGAPDQALARVYDAFTLAQELAHPPSLAFVLFFVTVVHQFRREPQAAGEQAEALVALCTAHGFALYLATGIIFRGGAMAAQGHAEEAIVLIQQGLAALQATGAVGLWRPYFLTLLAEATAQAGQPEVGGRLLAEAQTVLETTGERWWEAEVYRRRGELLWRRAIPEASQAETYLLQALTLARRQQAKSLELRTAISLSRLWQQGKRTEARQLLVEVYGGFTEGFDTADLQEAKALLDELASA